jgi:hypothetical protein
MNSTPTFNPFLATAITSQISESVNANSLGNANIGSVTIGKNWTPSKQYVFKNVSPPVSNGFPFWKR